MQFSFTDQINRYRYRYISFISTRIYRVAMNKLISQRKKIIINDRNNHNHNRAHCYFACTRPCIHPYIFQLSSCKVPSRQAAHLKEEGMS